jgi:hypothetical protein
MSWEGQHLPNSFELGRNVVNIKKVTVNGKKIPKWDLNKEKPYYKLKCPDGINFIVEIETEQEIDDATVYIEWEERASPLSSWQDLSSKGPYYLVEFVEGAGGHAFYQANRHYFMPTPPLGEVDWGWYWVGTTKPRSGYFEIDIFDVVQACVSYGSSGRGIPDPKWFPGADLAIAEDYKPGKIDIFDVVTVCINYGKKFGQPPNP